MIFDNYKKKNAPDYIRDARVKKFDNSIKF